MKKIEILTNEGNVITVNFEDNHYRVCDHSSVCLDLEASELECKKCAKKLNPIQWLHSFMKELNRLRYAREEAKEAAKLYEEKTKTQCQHCGRITKVNPPDKFSRRLRDIMYEKELQKIKRNKDLLKP